MHQYEGPKIQRVRLEGRTSLRTGSDTVVRVIYLKYRCNHVTLCSRIFNVYLIILDEFQIP